MSEANQGENRGSIKKCTVCGAEGHLSFDCPERGPKPLTPEQKDRALEELKGFDEFLQIEDNIEYCFGIEAGFKEELGGDINMVTVFDSQGAQNEFDRIFSDLESQQKAGGRRVCIIHDMEIPRIENGSPAFRFGLDSLTKIHEKVEKWNTEHPDKKLDVDIFVNSTAMGDKEEHASLQTKFPLIKGFGDSRDKLKVLESMERHFAQSQETGGEKKTDSEGQAASALVEAEIGAKEQGE